MAISVTVTSLADRVGQELGVSEWLGVTQERIDRFASATGDHQWIHVDAARAAVESPHGCTIAHGFLTLSLVSALLSNAITPVGSRMALNYGCDRVRFVSAVPVGSRIRGRFSVVAVADAHEGLQVTWGVVIEREGHDKPCVVLDWKVRYFPREVDS
jgi:acyl dehydratase